MTGFEHKSWNSNDWAVWLSIMAVLSVLALVLKALS